MNKKTFFILIFLLGVGVFGTINHSQAAGTLTKLSATPYDVTASSTTTYKIFFKTATTIANTGKVLIQFPAGFNISNATSTSWGGFDGGWNMSIASQTITLTRNGTGTSSAAGLKSIILSNVVNTSAVANNYSVIITTKNSSNTTLDGPNSTVYFQIFASHVATEIEGRYFFREGDETHYQSNVWDDSGTDIGTLSKTPPTLDEDRFCYWWIQFYFDENGTYTSTTTVSNVYYHTWWMSETNQGEFGYDETGVYGTEVTEDFTLNTTNSPKQVKDAHLYAGKQTLASPQVFFGNDIYNFGVKFVKSGSNPTIISSADQSSFIIFNLPDNIDTLGLTQDGDTDYDNDGLSDYDELFTYYTDPYDSDTDNDGWDDKYEIDNSLNPLDPDVAPVFDTWVRKYEGGGMQDYFGASIRSISDLDGDGLDDILVGAYYADPGGLTNAGSAYLYSSGTGNLIRQFNGLAASDGFGYSLASIADLDGDGLEDVVIGAYAADPGSISGAGSVYIYSSGTGNLIRQFNGLAEWDMLGYSLASISDLDGDGLEDVVIGAYAANPGGVSDAGSVYIYSSGTGNLIRQFNGGAASDYFGLAITSISDIDGDGLEDVVIGAAYADPGGISGAGSAYLYSSAGNLLQQYDGEAISDSFGAAVASISDIDGDGLEDVLVGAYAADPGGLTDAGSVYLYSSGTGNLIKEYVGLAAGDSFGNFVNSISDIDGDGKDDVLISAPTTKANNHSKSGTVYIYSSGTYNLIKQYNGENVRDYFGQSIISISDIDGDGKEDVVIGSHTANTVNFPGAGLVYIYSSADNIPTQTWSKNTAKENFDLDNYFKELNNDTLPVRNQTVTYTASTSDNTNIDISIASNGVATFSQPTNWLGTETVRFTATDSTGLSSTSTLVTLMVTGAPNTPSNLSLTVDSETQISASWSTNLNLATTTYYIENITAGTNSGWTSNTSWTSTGLSCGIIYSFQVKAKDGNGLISNYASGNVTTRGCVGGGGGVACSKVPDGSSISIQSIPNSSDVILNLITVPEVVNMSISNTSDFKNVGIESFISTKKWTPTSNKVYVRFYNSCGESSPVISASINLQGLTPTPTPTTSITPTPTPFVPLTDPQSILNSLLQQLADLQQQLANQQGGSTQYQFTRGLQYGNTGEDVTQLQIFLKNQGVDIYPEGLITGYFGNLTKLAVQRFQEKYNIAKPGDEGYGYVGPKTRAKINSF
jgi:hypothetical protein